ncbi:hypothetical protein L218DRAFT_954435 [Marasmius fiardii PR-910]|nr:hypothetical protein L218DRAFT_954435 [Marasmius fiardii PR-910]
MELPTPPPVRSRGISYRKPAPVYIPSPPPSPQTPSTSALSLSPADVQLYQSESIPPLPIDWKRRVQRARGLETTTLSDVGKDEKINDPRLPAGDVSMPQFPQASQSPRREVPHWQSYRPPTPPLPASTRKRRLADEDTPNDADTALQPFPDSFF